MNYKSKKSVFHDDIIKKEELSLDTKNKLKDSKYLIIILDILMLCVNIFMLGYFVLKGFDIIALSILGLIILMGSFDFDCVHFFTRLFYF